MIQAMVCVIGVHVGRGNIALGPDDVHDLGRIAAGDAFQFAGRKQIGIANDAALCAAERNIDHRAFPGHPGGERAHFIEGDVGSEANAAFGRSARDGVLHAIAGEYFQAAVVELDGDVDGQFEGGGAQNFAQPSSRLSRSAASSNRAAAESQGLISLSRRSRLENHRASNIALLSRATVKFVSGKCIKFLRSICVFRKPANHTTI